MIGKRSNEFTSNGTAYIVSLKFTPGLKKEFLALGENIRKKGMNVRYLLSARYARLEGNCQGMEYVTTSEDLSGILADTFRFVLGGKSIVRSFSSHRPDFVCFYNPHPLNPVIARLLKKEFPKTATALYLHDPYKPDKRPYGMAKAAYIHLVEFMQDLAVRHMDHVISPSECSSELFRARFPGFEGENHVSPLLIADQRTPEIRNRIFFSIVGTAHSATGHDAFTELVNYAAEKGMDYKFALISSSNISKYLEKLSQKARKIVKIINKKLITDSEINEVIRESHAVFRLDREVTQSGVIPVAFMNETPVIVRDIQGLRQHVRDRETGYIVPFECSPQSLLCAMEFVKDNFPSLSRKARMSYEETWSDRNFDKYYGWLIRLLNEQEKKNQNV